MDFTNVWIQDPDSSLTSNSEFTGNSPSEARHRVSPESLKIFKFFVSLSEISTYWWTIYGTMEFVIDA